MKKELTLEIAELFLEDSESVDLLEYIFLSAAAAETLGKHEGSLELSGLTSISDVAAKCLGKHN